MIAPRHLRRLLDVHGGFTLDPRSGEPVRRGLSVCLDPARARTFRRAAWSDAIVSHWLLEHTTELRRSGRFLGGWLDPERGEVCLDVVRVMPHLVRPAAVLLARHRGQRILYDLCADRLVPVGAGS